MRIKNVVYAGALIFFSVFIFLSCNRTDSKINVKEYSSLSDSTNYIGKEACKQCHSDKFETFMHTGMGMSFDTASKAKSAGNFTAHSVIKDNYRNLSYFPHWEGDSFYLTEFRLSGKDTSYLRKEKINYIVGSGQHTNSHMINVNGYIYQAPATFYTQSGKWDLPPGYENGFNNRFNRLIELECMSCHNAFPEMVLGSANKFINVPSGIDCERCHGPGEKHQIEMLAGRTIDVKNEIDYSIVNPAKLEINLQLDVCQRCHVQGNAVLMKDKSFFDFKPGMHLSEVMNIFMPVYKGDDDQHIMASHAERMKLSKCFTASLKIAEASNSKLKSKEPYKNAMTCVTCHDPHVSVKSTAGESFNNACKSCHSSVSGKIIGGKNPLITENDCTADPKQRALKKDNCVSFHMPKNGTIDIPHVTTTDHWIRKPVSRSDKEQIREFVKLACINNPEADDRSKGIAYLSYYEKFVTNKVFLDSAKRYINDNSKQDIIENFNELIRWAFLKKDYQGLLKYVSEHGNALSALNKKSFSNDDAWTAYRIGQAFSELGDKTSAELYFNKATELAPFYPDFRLKLADLQFETGQYEKSGSNYRFIISENPRFVAAYINYGFLELSINKEDKKAEQLYKVALDTDPDNEQALLNMAGLMVYRNQKVQAKEYISRVLKINPENAQALRLLKLL
ncbi:MAG: tetratricopeptide repeat protein [Bacteroidetes bacterium]|nr:tetratricopeptide repeat protein [Bacteroidota bacterium]